MRNVSKIGGVSMNRKERAWQGSEASLSILTREPAVVELFKILKSNRLSPCKCHFKLPLYFPRNSSSLPPPPLSFFREPKTVILYTSRIFPLNFSEEISSFFLFFSFLPSQGTRKSYEESTRLFFTGE